MLPAGTRFASDEIPCTMRPYSNRPSERWKWLQKVKASLVGCNIVFLDPDNGLEPPGFRPTRRRAGKSVQYSELMELNERGRTLVVYHHYFREAQDAQISDLSKTIKSRGFHSIDVLRWHRISPRAFFILNASAALRQRANALTEAWEGHVTCHMDCGARDQFTANALENAP